MDLSKPASLHDRLPTATLDMNRNPSSMQFIVSLCRRIPALDTVSQLTNIHALMPRAAQLCRTGPTPVWWPSHRPFRFSANTIFLPRV